MIFRLHLITLFILFSVCCVQPALADCLVRKDFEQNKIESLSKLEECSLAEIFDKNNLDQETFSALIAASAEAFPETRLILNFERAFRDSGRHFFLLERYKEHENALLKKELASVFFDQYLNESELRQAFVLLRQLMGQEKAEKIIDALLLSDNANVISTVSDMVSRMPNEISPDLQIKAKSILIDKAARGDAVALKALLMSDFIDLLESGDFVYELIKDYPDHNLTGDLATLVLLSIDRALASKVSSDLIQNLVFKSAQHSIDQYKLMRAVFSITHDKRFDFRFQPVFKAETDFEKCVITPDEDFFECLRLLSPSGELPLEELYFLRNFSLVFEHFDIKFNQKLGNRLIDAFYSRDYKFELKKKFTDMIFAGLSLRGEERSIQTWNALAKIKNTVNDFMWANHVDQIITLDSIDTFPIANELEDYSIQYIDFFQPSNNQQIEFTENFKIDLILSKIDMATDKEFFYQLSLIMYKLYIGSDFTTEKIESLIDRSLSRVDTLYGQNSEIYNDLMFHKYLIGSQTGTIETVSFLLQQIEKVGRIGSGIDKWEDALINSYSAAGRYLDAKIYAQNRTTRLIEKRNKYYEEGGLDHSYVAVNFDTQICLQFINLIQIEALLREEMDSSKVIKHCFNDFNYHTNKTLLLAQYDAFKTFAASYFQIFGQVSDIRSKKLQKYLTELLADESSPKYFKSPFAFAALLMAEDKDQRDHIRKNFLTRHVYRQFPKLILETEQPVFEFYERFADKFINQGDKSVEEAATDLLRFGEIYSQPTLNQPFASNTSLIKSNKYPPQQIKMALEVSNYGDVAVRNAFIGQQHLKFGPSEQLLLRHSELGNSYTKQVSALILEREILVERMVSERQADTSRGSLMGELARLNQSLADLGKVDVLWGNVYPDIIRLSDQQADDVLYLDFRHHFPTDTVGVFHLNSDGIGYSVVDGAKKLEVMTSSLVQKLRNGDQNFSIEAQAIAQILIAPFITQKTKKILISPHSFLFNVPYDALLLGRVKTGNKPSDALSESRGIKITEKSMLRPSEVAAGFENFLGIRYEVALTSNIVSGNTNPNEGENEFFGVGDPVFFGEKSEQRFAFSRFQSNPERSAISLSTLPALPETRAELQALSELTIFSKSTLLTGFEATKENVLKHPGLRSASVISFATHGLANGQISSYSLPGLALTPSETSESTNDGFLSMMDVLNTKLTAELVILSACETGSARSLHSPPFSGLVASFLAAGAQNVLASLWPIYSDATKKLMVSIGQNKNLVNDWANAKKNGIRAFIKAYPEYSHPVFWAPFVMYTSVNQTFL